MLTGKVIDVPAEGRCRRGKHISQTNGRTHTDCSRKDNRRCLPRRPAETDHAAGQNAGKRCRKNHGGNGIPFRGAKAERCFAVGFRHGKDGLFCSTDNGGQNHDGKRQRTGKNTFGFRDLQRIDEKGKTEHAEHNTRHSGKGAVGTAQHAVEKARFGILGEIDGGDDSKGKGKEHRTHRKEKGTLYFRPDAAEKMRVDRAVGYKAPVDRELRNKHVLKVFPDVGKQLSQ